MRSFKSISYLLLFVFSIISCKNSKIIENTIDGVVLESYSLNDTFNLVLNNNFTGGYEWIWQDNEAVRLLSSNDSIYFNQQTQLHEHALICTFILVKVGETDLIFHKKRTFEPDSLAIKNDFFKTITIK